MGREVLELIRNDFRWFPQVWEGFSLLFMGKNKESIKNHPEPSSQILQNPKYHPKTPKYHTAKIEKHYPIKDPWRMHIFLTFYRSSKDSWGFSGIRLRILLRILLRIPLRIPLKILPWELESWKAGKWGGPLGGFTPPRENP